MSTIIESRPTGAREIADAIHRKLDALQFGTDDPSSRYLLVSQDEYGFGAQVHRRVLALKMGLLSSRTVVFNDRSYGPYANCFEPLCGRVASEFEDAETVPLDPVDPEACRDARVAYLDFDAFWADQPEFWKFHHSVPDELREAGLDYRFLEGVILERFRILPDYRADLDAIRERIGFRGPIIGIQIRRGDKKDETPYVPLRKYFAEMLGAVRKTGIGRIFVTSDDPHVFDRLPRVDGVEYVYDDQEPRYNNANHRLIAENPDLQRQETLTALKIYDFLRSSDFLVGQDNAHLLNLAVASKITEQLGKDPSVSIPGTYTTCLSKADPADWPEVLKFKIRAFQRKHGIPGFRSLVAGRSAGR